ncbi:MAG: Sialidase precursor [Verrucomicrobiota bacterium]|jgi:sialidase-1
MKILAASLVLALACAAAETIKPAAPTATAAAVEPIAIFAAKQHGYAGFRIPALLRTQDGRLLAFAEGRKNNLGDAGDIDLVMMSSTDEGKTWGGFTVLADEGKNFIGNPAPVLDERDGSITVLLTWKVDGAHEGDIRKGKQAPAMIWSIRSTDGGKTWSKAEERKELSTELLARGWRWNIPGPGRAIQLKNGEHKGRLVCAGNHSGSGGEGNRFLGGNSFFSDDGGKTWKLGAVDAAPAEGRPAKGDFVYPNESTCAELPDGRIVFSTRDQGGPSKANRGIAWSKDGGASFEAAYAPDHGLTGPVCQGSLLSGTDAAGKPVLLCSFPSGKGREKLLIRLSRDGGKSWQDGPLLFPGAAAYSDLVQLAPGRFLAIAELKGYGGISALPFEIKGE